MHLAHRPECTAISVFSQPQTIYHLAVLQHGARSSVMPMLASHADAQQLFYVHQAFQACARVCVCVCVFNFMHKNFDTEYRPTALFYKGSGANPPHSKPSF